jgi:type IV secretion system protein TrbF
MAESRIAQAIDNPYLDAQRVWDERYGDSLAQARNWRLIAFLALGVAGIAVGGVIWIGSQSKFIPYVVDRTDDGSIRSVGYAVKRPEAGLQVERGYIMRWLQDFRTVSSDAALEKQTVLRLYSFIKADSPGLTKANEYFRRTSPFDRARSETVTVEVDEPTSVTKVSWNVSWTETIRDRSGAVIDKQRWAGTLQLVQEAPDDRPIDVVNPLSVYVSDFDFAQVKS